MRKNKLRELLRQGKVAIGAIVDSADPHHIEIMGQIGYDFVFTDHEHTSRDVPQIEGLIYAADAAQIPCLVRIRDLNAELIGRILDAGAMGIILSHTDTREDAVKLTRAAKYPPFYPSGERGVSHTARAHDISSDHSAGFLDNLKVANEETMVFALVESKSGIENIDGIVSVGGLDGIFLGKGDLSLELGIYGQTEHPQLIAATEKVIGAVRKHNKLLWLTVWDPGKAEAAARLGANLICIVHDYSHLKVLYQGFLKKMRGAIEKARM